MSKHWIFETNIDVLRSQFDLFIVIWEIPDQNKNKSSHKTDWCYVLSDCWLEVHSAILWPFPAAAAAATGLWIEPQTAGEIVFFLSFWPVYVFFYQIFFFMIFDSNYYQTIQTAVLYKKSTFKMFKCNLFMFLYLQGSFDQNKNES